MIRTASRLTVVSLALAAAAAGAAWADGEPFQVLGKVKKADGGGAAPFELTASGGPYEVVLAPDAEVLVHRLIGLADVQEGSIIHLLGKRNGDSYDSRTHETRPAHYYQVLAIVVGDPFSPPPVPPDIAVKGVAWFSGRLSPRPGYNQLALDGQYLIGGGRDGKAIRVDRGGPASVAKGKVLRVEGTLDRGAKPKRVTAARVALVDPTLTADQIRFVLGESGARAGK